MTLESATTPGGGGSLDTAFGLLADETRRHLLYLLREHETFASDDLADVLTGWLAVRRGDGHATATDHTRIELELHHVHLPQLAEAGVLEHDDTGTVTLRSLPESLDRLLDAALALEPSTTAATVAAAEPESG